ncbi:hypothetical protein PG994_006943 [Apiospora phragmitis]|uniref:LAGLIDADG homing endonuclease n=1 Tax=Apiospora phragmitis TaxID=2905665 RepID=A0ABR1VHI3_9PEZI
MSPLNQGQKPDAIARAVQSGYQPFQHIVTDSIRGLNKYKLAVHSNQDRVLSNYITWRMKVDQTTQGHSEAFVRATFLGEQCEFPPLAELKDFLRFYIHQSQGRITKNGLPTLDTMKIVAEWFFAGFTRHTTVVVPQEDRSEVYTWLRIVVCEEERLIENVHVQKFNFTKKELDRVMRGLLTRPDLKYMHERTRIQIAYIIPTYCWSGARLGAFFTGGLC